MSKRYVYWEFNVRKDVLETAAKMINEYPDELARARARGKFINSTVLNHVFNTAQEYLDIDESFRRGKMTNSDVQYFNTFYGEV